MSAESVALFGECVECKAAWLPADEERWQANLGCDEHRDEPAQVVLYCPECAEREFGGA